MNSDIAALALAAGLAAAPALAADIGVSVQISQPGVYGRVDIGRHPQPVLIAPQPVVVARPVVAAPEPLYLWVPPGHRRNWQKHCGHYNACGAAVYFVDDRWYEAHVMADRHHGDHGDHHEGKEHGKGHR